MDKFDFNKIVYKRPYLRRGTRYIKDVIGLDSETLISGKPFIFCMSTGDSCTLSGIPDIFFTRKYRGKQFVVYNLKFDSGSILYNLPLKVLNNLRLKTYVSYNGFRYTYIPHKLLRISKGKNAVSIWDMRGFFEGGLDYASQKHLGVGKQEIETKRFTASYAKANLDKLKKYCIHDSNLVRELALYYLRKLHTINLRPNTLYSTASISFQYFKQHSNIVTAWELWNTNREVLRYASNSYYGGKVENTSRGIFNGYEYDINSAYAYEISNLININKCRVVVNSKYLPAAAYSFYRVYIHDIKNINHPIVVKSRKTNLYPTGSFYSYITKGELEYLYKNNIDVKIIKAYHILVKDILYPYRETVLKLQQIKEQYKEKDPFLSTIAKLCNNSFYGKMCQCIADRRGNLNAGVGWNPVYSSVITANVRIRVSDLQNQLKQACLAVHTDAVITTEPIPSKYVENKLGSMLLKRSGSGIVIMTGMYKLGDKNAYSGFKMPKSFDWSKKLRELGDKSEIQLTFNESMSWIKAVVEKRPQEINRFINNTTTLDLNAENKRMWLQKTTGNKLLTGLEHSLPIVYIEPYKNRGI